MKRADGFRERSRVQEFGASQSEHITELSRSPIIHHGRKDAVMITIESQSRSEVSLLPACSGGVARIHNSSTSTGSVSSLLSSSLEAE